MTTKTRKIALMLGVAVMMLGSANAAMADNHKHGPKRDMHHSQKRDMHHSQKRGPSHGPSKHFHHKHVHKPIKHVYRPSPHYHTPQRTVIYYNTTPYAPRSYYRETYVVGGYLPHNRVWHPINDYARYGLRRPGHGERWVHADRDAYLISEATSRIISGIVLAAAIR